MENNQNHIEDIFRDAFANHEMEVSSNVWAGVQSSIASQGAAGTVAASTGMLKAAAVIGITSVVAIGTVNEIKLQSNPAPQLEVVLIENTVPQTDNEAEQVEAVEWAASEEIQTIETPAFNQETVQIIEVEEVEAETVDPVEVQEESDVASDESGNAVSNDQLNSNIEESSATTESTVDYELNNKVEETTRKANAPQPKSNEDALVDAPQNDEEEEPKVCNIDLSHKAMGFISPDGDGTNECFSLNDADQAQSFHIKIFTREGVQVFESSDPNFSWCGTDRFGNVLPARTMCYFQIDAFDENGLQYTKKNAKGSVQIFR